jgi:mediator of RNA polymerase II transcription subunit 14
MASNIPLAVLLDSLLQKSYHELTVLAELLPRKSDVDRKIGIVGFARQTRLQLVRLLALVKWAGSSDSVQKCSVSLPHYPKSTLHHVNILYAAYFV